MLFMTIGLLRRLAIYCRGMVEIFAKDGKRLVGSGVVRKEKVLYNHNRGGEDMNKRRMDIIHDLTNLEYTMTIAQLTEKYEVSSRTIRNDLNAINEILTEKGFVRI